MPTNEQKEKYLAKAREYKKNNKEKIKEQRKEYDIQYFKNLTKDKKEKKYEYYREQRKKNNESKPTPTPEEIETKRLLKKEAVKLSNKKYREKNAKKIKADLKKYYIKNKDKIIKRQIEYEKNRKKTDIVYYVRRTTSNLIRSAFRTTGVKKITKTESILGCSFQQFKEHLESNFEPWMNWDNYGLYNGTENYGWDIDHITPISSAKTEEDVIMLNHYNNLQPLCSYINREVKKDK